MAALGACRDDWPDWAAFWQAQCNAAKGRALSYQWTSWVQDEPVGLTEQLLQVVADLVLCRPAAVPGPSS